MTTRKRIEKLTLNNQVIFLKVKIHSRKNHHLFSPTQIVGMRKDVKRARLWIINNLNQRAKKLCAKKGNEEETTKNTRKATRFRDEIQVLKHIDINEVSKFALCNQHEEKTLQKDIDTLETEQRALLRLATHPFIQNQVTKFRETHAVPMDRLVLLIRSLGLQYQKKKLKKSATEVNSTASPLKEKKSLSQPKSTFVVSSAQTSTTKKKEGNAGAPAKDVTTLIAPAKKVIEKQEKGKLPRNLSKEVAPKGEAAAVKEVRESTVTQDKAIPSVIKQEKTHLKVMWPESRAPTIDKKIGTMEIKQLHLDKITTENISLADKIDRTSSPSVANEPPRDSFFIGGVDFPEEETTIDSDQDRKKFRNERSVKNRKVPQDVAPREKKKPIANTTDKRELQNEKRANKLANLAPLGKARQFGGKQNDKMPAAAAKSGKTSFHF